MRPFLPVRGAEPAPPPLRPEDGARAPSPGAALPEGLPRSPRRQPRGGSALPSPSGAVWLRRRRVRGRPRRFCPALPCPVGDPSAEVRARPGYRQSCPVFPGGRICSSPEEQPELGGCSCMKLSLCPPILCDSRRGGGECSSPTSARTCTSLQDVERLNFFFSFFLVYFGFGTIESELWRLLEKLVQVRAMTFLLACIHFSLLSRMGHTAHEKVYCVVLFCG